MSAAALLLLCLLPALPIDLAGQDAVLRARERAQVLTDMEAILTHRDANMRMAGFEEAMQSGDQALRTLAMDKALGGDDQNLQTAALRALLQERSELAVTVILPDRPTPPQQYTFDQFHGLRMTRVALQGNEIQWRQPNTSSGVSGQLVPGGFELQPYLGNASCVLSARIAGAKLMTGSIDCVFRATSAQRAGGTRGTLPIRIDLP